MENTNCNCSPSKQKIVVMLTAIIGLTLVLSLALRQDSQSGMKENYTMSVSATGEVVAKPDVAIISVGVKTTEKMKVEDVVAENTAKINKIINAIKAENVDKDDIKTSSYNLYPVYDYLEEKGRVLKGYALDQQLQIKIRDMENIGGLIEVVTRNGANRVSDVQFTIDDPEELKEEARNIAIAKAKDKAKSISKASGIKLDKIVNVSESNVSPRYASYDNAMLKTESAMGGEFESPEIATGEMEITANINIVYKIK